MRDVSFILLSSTSSPSADFLLLLTRQVAGFLWRGSIAVPGTARAAWAQNPRDKDNTALQHVVVVVVLVLVRDEHDVLPAADCREFSSSALDVWPRPSPALWPRQRPSNDMTINYGWVGAEMSWKKSGEEHGFDLAT